MRNYNQGKFTPKNPQKYSGNVLDIVYRSSWEKKFMIWADTNPAVVLWTSEYPIQYYSRIDEKARRYFVDFFVKVRSITGEEKVLMVEVKPESQTREPQKPRTNNPRSLRRYESEMRTYILNTDKWIAARTFAENNGFQFIILNEYDLGVAIRKGKKK